MSEKSLKQKTLHGVGWSAIDAFLGRGITFIVGIVLARLLSPSEYGLIGICVIFNSILEGFVDSGFGASLIRKKNVSNLDYNTMFFVNMAVSILMYALLFFSTPLIAEFFEQPLLTSLIRVTGLVILFDGLSFTQNTILTRNINFKAKAVASLISSIISGLIGITFALTNFGVWALVAQLISKSIFNTIVLWFINKWWPTWDFSIKTLRYMWGFGWKILLTGLIDRTWQQAYQTVVGKFYSPSTLGQYTTSKEYATLFSSGITTIVMKVSYPVLSSIQEDMPRMVAAYRKIIKQTMFVTVICLMLLASISYPLIHVLIGEKWDMAASFLPLICISFTFYPLHSINMNMLKVIGRSDLILKYDILKRLIGIFPIILGIFVGIYPMLISLIFTNIISFFINSWYTGKKLGYTSWMQIKDISTSYLIGSFVGLSIYFFKYLPIADIYILIIQFVVAGGLLLLICEKIKSDEYMEIRKIVFSLIKRRVR